MKKLNSKRLVIKKSNSIQKLQQNRVNNLVEKHRDCDPCGACRGIPGLNGKDGQNGKDGTSCCNCFNFNNAIPAITIVVNTGNQFDIAINGNGFFVIELPSSQLAFTRYGHFQLDVNSQLVTPQGYLLLQDGNIPVTLPIGFTSFTVSASGLVTVVVASVPMTIGQLELAIFANPAGLQYIGNYIYLETANSGVAVLGNPNQGPFGSLQQFFLEESTVNDQSRIYTDAMDFVVSDPGSPDAYPGHELGPSNDDGNLGFGFNIYENVQKCSLGPTLNYIGAGFGGSEGGLGQQVYNYGQILVRNLITGLDCGCVQRVTVDTYLGMTDYGDTLPAFGVLIVLLWNVMTQSWESQYENDSFPIQNVPNPGSPLTFQEVTLDLCINGCNYIDENGFINFFIYTPYSGTLDNPMNPAQINMDCFNVCTFCACDQQQQQPSQMQNIKGLDVAEFYFSSNSGSNVNISFPEIALSGKYITQISPSKFNLSKAGTYKVYFQLNGTEGGQIAIKLNDEILKHTITTASHRTSLVKVAKSNSILSIYNHNANMQLNSGNIIIEYLTH